MLWARALFETGKEASLATAVGKARQGIQEALNAQGLSEEDRTSLVNNALACARMACALPWEERREVLFFLDSAEKLCTDETLKGEVIFRRGCFFLEYASFEEAHLKCAIEEWQRLLLDHPDPFSPRASEAVMGLAVAWGRLGNKDESVFYLHRCLSPALQASWPLRTRAQELLDRWQEPFLNVSVSSMVRDGEPISISLDGSGDFQVSVSPCDPVIFLESLPFLGDGWPGSPLQEGSILKQTVTLKPGEPRALETSAAPAGVYVLQALSMTGEGVERALLAGHLASLAWRTSRQVLVWSMDPATGKGLENAEVWLKAQGSDRPRQAGRTDSKGFLSFDLAEPDREVHLLVLSGPEAHLLSLDALAPPDPTSPLFSPSMVSRIAPSAARAGQEVSVGLLREKKPGEGDQGLNVELLGPDGQVSVRAVLSPVCEGAYQGTIRIPSWLRGGLYALQIEGQTDPLFPWVSGVLVEPPPAGTSRIRVAEAPEWVKTGEDIRVQGRLIGGWARPQAIPKAHIHTRVFRERRDAFEQEIFPVSSFWKGGKPHAEGETFTDADGRMDMTFSSKPYQRESVFRVELECPELGTSSCCLVQSLKEPFFPVLNLSTQLAMEEDSVQGRVLLLDPWGHPVAGRSLSVDVRPGQGFDVQTGPEGSAEFSLPILSQETLVKITGEDVFPVHSTILRIPGEGEVQGTLPLNPQVIFSKDHYVVGEGMRVGAMSPSSSEGILVILSPSQLLGWTSLGAGARGMTVSSPDPSWVLAEVICVTGGNMLSETGIASVASEPAEASSIPWIVAREELPAWGQCPRFGATGLDPSFAGREAGLLGLRACYSREWSVPERRSLASSSPFAGAVASYFPDMGWPWILDEVGRSIPSSSGRAQSRVLHGEVESRDRFTRGRMVLPGLEQWSDAPMSMDRAGDVRVGCGQAPDLEERPGFAVEQVNRLGESKSRISSTKPEEGARPRFLRSGDTWEIGTAPCSVAGGRVIQEESGARIEPSGPGEFVIEQEGVARKMVILPVPRGSAYSLCVPLGGTTARVEIPEEMRSSPGVAQVLISGRLSRLCAGAAEGYRGFVSGTEAQIFSLLLDPEKGSESLQGVLAGQNPDGGWSWMEQGPSDSWLTSISLLSLFRSNRLALEGDLGFRRGLDFLRKCPESDRSHAGNPGLFHLFRAMGIPLDDRSLNETSPIREGQEGQEGFSEVWGDVAEPLEQLLDLRDGQDQPSFEACWKGASNPCSLPLERGIWTEVARKMESDAQETDLSSLEIFVGGQPLSRSLGLSGLVVEGSRRWPSLPDEMEIQMSTSVQGWLVFQVFLDPSSPLSGSDPRVGQVTVENEANGEVLSPDQGVFAVRRGERLFRRLTIQVPARARKIALAESLPAGLEPWGDFSVDGSPVRPEFTEDGVIARVEEWAPGEHEIRYALTAEHAGIFATAGSLIRALKSSDLCVWIPSTIWQVTEDLRIPAEDSR